MTPDGKSVQAKQTQVPLMPPYDAKHNANVIITSKAHFDQRNNCEFG